MDVTSQPVQLSATPQTLWVATQIEAGNTPPIQVRTASAGPVNLIASNALGFLARPALQRTDSVRDVLRIPAACPIVAAAKDDSLQPVWPPLCSRQSPLTSVQVRSRRLLAHDVRVPRLKDVVLPMRARQDGRRD